MEHAPGDDGLPPRIGRPAGAGSATEPVSATVVLRSLEVVGYGRHAAPASAYGPSDVHRLLPEPPSVPRAADAGADEAPMTVLRHELAEPAGNVAATDGGAGDRSSDGVPTKVTGFFARLRLLPKAA